MSYHPSQVNISEVPSGIVYYGASASDQVYEADSGFTIGGGYLSATAIKVDDGSTIGSDTTPNAITIAGNGDVSILKNLTINGTLTSVATDNIIVEDPLMFLASGNSANLNDIGFFGTYNDGANAEYAGLFRDADDGKFKLFHSLENQPTTTVNTGGTGYTKGILVADLEGNADTATELQTARYIGVADQVTGSGLFDGSANLSFDVQLTADAINDQTEATSSKSSDYIIIASGTSLRKITKGNFVSDLGGGTMSSFNVDADQGTAETVENGNTLSLLGGSGLISTVSATDTVTFDVQIDDDTIGINGSDQLYVKDGSITESKLSRTIEEITSSKTAVKDITLVDAGSNSVTVTLPEQTSVTTAGKVMIVKRIDGSSNDVIIQRSGSSDTIDGSTQFQLYYQWETLTFVSDGADWYII